MRICFFCGGFNTNGGIGRVTSIVANGLERLPEYDIFLCSFYEEHSGKYYDVDDTIKKDELFSHFVTMTNAFLKEHAIRKLCKYISDNHIEIIVACGALYFPLAVVAAKKCKIKSICWEHMSPTVTTDYKFQKQARLLGTRFCDCNVVLTKFALAWYRKNTKFKRVVQIYNPIDPAFTRQPINYAITSKKIVSVGRLSYQKNFSRLLDIANVVLRNNQGWTWDIYGEGEERKNLEEKIKQLNLAGKVNLKGQISDMYDRYKDYSFYVMTSRYEGFPMVLLEAASCGLPLVAFDIHTGPNEIIDNNENGFLINEDSDKDMIDAVEKLITQPQLREQMSEKSAFRSRNFSADKIIQRWDKLFHKLSNC